jgi:hypothetical protein
MTEPDWSPTEFFASLAAYDRAQENSPLVEPVFPPEVDLDSELNELFRRISK